MKNLFLLLEMIALFGAGNVLAQLPASPWDTKAFDEAVKASATTTTTQSAGSADVGHIKKAATERVNIPSITYNPTNADAEAPVYVPAIDSQGNAKTGVQVQAAKYVDGARGTTVAAQQRAAAGDPPNPNNGSWRGSGIYGNLDYTGNVTTYDTAVGQEMLAPEVNTHNMNKMIQHLRNLGYKIPESYDNKFQNLTKDYAKDLRTAYDGLGHQHNPFDTMFSGFLDIVEEQSGLDMENLLFNSVDLMSRE
ncbi:MAG: hypothetical protein MJ210_02655 [Alphaproteobacteria bacterium]|nr:hypothetical protein [Alphaproteobacteria bacterium]